MESNIYAIAIAGLILTGQLLLCFLLKRLWLKLLPAGLSFTAALVFFILMVTIQGWDAVGYLILMVISLAVLGVCALGWGIWAIAAIIRKRKK